MRMKHGGMKWLGVLWLAMAALGIASAEEPVAIRKAGYALSVYTINDGDVARALVGMGVDCVTSGLLLEQIAYGDFNMSYINLLTSLCGFAALVFSGFPGLAQLGELGSIGWLPGALADHLTSFGGVLDGGHGLEEPRMPDEVAALIKGFSVHGVRGSAASCSESAGCRPGSVRSLGRRPS